MDRCQRPPRFLRACREVSSARGYLTSAPTAALRRLGVTEALARRVCPLARACTAARSSNLASALGVRASSRSQQMDLGVPPGRHRGPERRRSARNGSEARHVERLRSRLRPGPRSAPPTAPASAVSAAAPASPDLTRERKSLSHMRGGPARTIAAANLGDRRSSSRLTSSSRSPSRAVSPRARRGLGSARADSDQEHRRSPARAARREPRGSTCAPGRERSTSAAGRRAADPDGQLGVARRAVPSPEARRRASGAAWLGA